MKRKVFFGLLILCIVLVPILTACNNAATSPTTSKAAVPTTSIKPATVIPTPTAAPPTTSAPVIAKPAVWWDKFGKPQYGGTITLGQSSFQMYIDPYLAYHSAFDLFAETLFTHDWTLDRKIWPFNTQLCLDEYWTGLLAKTWTMKDPTTMVVKLQEGVKWQNKPPVNGREFTAYDVQYHYDRHMGTGEGYTKAGSYATQLLLTLQKVTAVDKYTVEFKFKFPTAMAFTTVNDQNSRNMFEPPELVKTEGAMKDWKNANGTGPWMLTDFVADSAVTFTKNPDYWGFDPRYPQNKLPYADKFIVSVIPDLATKVAALRTGKIDRLEAVDWQQAQSLVKSNPELQQDPSPARTPSLNLVVNKAPWSDVNVRKALDMAIDRKGMAQSLYGGTVDGTPSGITHPVLANAGWGFAYKDWPQALKDEYSFNPTKAKQLLAAAGFPTGFKTTIQTATTGDMALMQIIKSNWKDIGVDAEIVTYEPAAFTALTTARKVDNMYYDAMGHTGSDSAFTTIMGTVKAGDSRNGGFVDDPVWEKAYTDFAAATSMDQVKAIIKVADQRAIEQHWSIAVCPYFNFDVMQPYVKGSSGEVMGSASGFLRAFYYKYLWVDQAAKKAAGR